MFLYIYIVFVRKFSYLSFMIYLFIIDIKENNYILISKISNKVSASCDAFYMFENLYNNILLILIHINSKAS